MRMSLSTHCYSIIAGFPQTFSKLCAGQLRQNACLLELPGWLGPQHVSSFPLIQAMAGTDSVLWAVEACKGLGAGWQSREALWRGDIVAVGLEGQAGDSRCRGRRTVEGPTVAMWLIISHPPLALVVCFLHFLWRWQILRPKAPAVYQGPSQGWGFPLPAAEAVRPWLRKQLKWGTPGRGAGDQQ